MVKVRIDKRMPGVLTMTQADMIEKFKGFEDELRANRYANKTKGQLYTQVDVERAKDGRDVAYLRGYHLVNRTGYWVVVKPSKGELTRLKRVM
jgi:hypothetical protein